ncbi:unnamed protein product [Durusdinium trenchii]|uniref:Uncharacterized protein n=2 Tax=Durusdinium trenchii TaxID=1381693 RepID=A0ABP0Q9X6_9DINO
MKGMFFMGRVRRSLRSAFHRKHPGECMPAAPLRALGYTSAGGCFASIGRNGKPVSALMKIGYATGSGNVYCNKIVLMDEAHNLVRSQTQYADQLQRLRRLLYEAEKLVLAGFTGTPILSEPNEGRQLLDIIKGVKAPSGDEGFLSSFPMRPQPLFPVSLPRGLPDGALTLARQKQLVRRVEIRGEALKVYDLKRRLGLPGRRLRAYCNVSIFHAAFHDGRAGSKGRVLAYPEDCCPKLLQIAQAVVAEPLKAVIMIGRTSGYVVMLELMKRLAAKAEPPFQVATMNELSEFNHVSNLRGQIFRVLVADSLQCSEGVSFLSIRKTYLADVPVSPSGFIQQCGRSIRMYGHRGLPEEEQTVTTQLYVSMLPKWMRSSSLACWALRAQKKHTRGKEVEKRARVLTARMNRAGIHSLEELKSRLDAHGEAKQRSLGRMTKEGLTVEDVLTFLEQNGLWEEAKLLRNADKKDKEKAQAMEESMQSLGDSQLTRGNTLESLDRGNTLEEDDFTTALASMLEEAMGKDEMGDAERQQEMEAFKEEQDADDLDGEEKRKAAPPASNAAPSAPRRAASSSALDAAVAEPPAVRPMSSQEVVASLGEVLQALRAACREADKKPLLNDTTAEAQADAADTAAPSSEAMPTATAAAPADGAEDGSAGETSAVPNAESGALAAPVVEAGAPEALREPTSATGSPVAPVVFGEEPWRAPLVAALEKAQRDGSVAFQSARSAVASLDPEFKALTLHQVRCLRDEVVKVEKVETLRMAVSMIKEVKVMISDLQSVSVQAADAEPDADAPMPDRSAADAPVAAPDAAETAGETPVVVVVKATISPEERQQKELQWRRHLGRAFRELKRSEHVRAALEVAAPGVLEKTVAAEAKVDVEKDPTIEEEEDSDLLSLGLGLEHVKRLHDELVRLLELAEKGAAKPRAMVRAMQMLYLADSASEAIASLKPETADEEALQQLSERTEEFAPALEAMRSLAVDRDVFSHLADEWVEEHGEVHHSESEASDLNKELGKKEPAPVVLPSGWRMEWVKRKKKEMREFVDHEGNRYRSVREVRAALLEYEARQAALQAAQKAAAEAAAAAAAAEVAPKRRRLRGKCSSAAYGLPGAAGVAQSMAAAAPARVAAAPEEDFAEELMKALGLPPDTPSKSSTAPPAPSSSATAGSKTPRTGCKVRILTEQPRRPASVQLGMLPGEWWKGPLQSREL